MRIGIGGLSQALPRDSSIAKRNCIISQHRDFARWDNLGPFPEGR